MTIDTSYYSYSNNASYLSQRRRPHSREDARILRGAEFLRQQLIHSPVSFQEHEQEEEPELDEEMVWRDQEAIQQDTARIHEDLICSVPSGRPPRPPSPLGRRRKKGQKKGRIETKIAAVVTEDEGDGGPQIEDLWETATKSVNAQPKTPQLLQLRDPGPECGLRKLSDLIRGSHQDAPVAWNNILEDLEDISSVKHSSASSSGRSPPPGGESEKLSVQPLPAGDIAKLDLSPIKQVSDLRNVRSPLPEEDSEKVISQVYPEVEITFSKENKGQEAVQPTDGSECKRTQAASQQKRSNPQTSSVLDIIQAEEAELPRESEVLQASQKSQREEPLHSGEAESNIDDLYDFIENDYDDDDIDIALSAHKDASSKNEPSPGRKRSIADEMIKGTGSESLMHSLFSSMTQSTARSIAHSSDRQGPPNTEDYNPCFADMDAIEVVAMGKPEPDVSTVLLDYSILLEDPAYLHAQHAGFLWQSLVGQHVRFPSRWWNGLPGPPLNIGEDDDLLPAWYQVGRFPVRNHKYLKRLVKTRASGGRLLLHVMVQDTLIHKPVCDVAIGCYHPNARGIRTTSEAQTDLENTRFVWMAVRKRTPWSVTVLDRWLSPNPSLRTPIGEQRITNENVRVVYGEKPPVETLLLPENVLYERLVSASNATPPALVLLDSFVFNEK